jgi:hypothetical protein
VATFDGVVAGKGEILVQIKLINSPFGIVA